jgi:hypothetical protein
MRRLSPYALILAAMLFLCPVSGSKASTTKFTGWITDELCGVRGAMESHKECAIKCWKQGRKLVFYSEADRKIYKLDNQEMAFEHVAQEVDLVGELDGDTIKVSSIEEKKSSGS